jgi:thiol-disulfide isomerase/thioredoxin
MQAGKVVIAGVALAALIAVAAIVAVTPDRSSVQSGAVEALRPSEELLPFTWHDRPRPLPEFTFTDAEGAPLSLADFRGRTVLINLWATWCAPCLREMPMLDALAREAEGPGFAVLALNQDRGGAEIAVPFWEELGLRSLRLYLDPGLAANRAIDPIGLPLTVLVDREGRELARLAGIAEWSAPAVVAYFKALGDSRFGAGAR